MKKENNIKHESCLVGYLQEKLNDAIAIARKAHQGQYDKAYQPYFKHPEAVNQIVINNLCDQASTSESFMLQASIVSYLHDVIEDTSISTADLRKSDIPEACIVAIELLTKKKGQDYWEYLSEIKQNKLARAVKIADMLHNSDLSRLPHITDEDKLRREKYLKGIAFLTDE
jgi:(p)ppGpp synthase/HD superfamily hydrolase